MRHKSEQPVQNRERKREAFLGQVDGLALFVEVRLQQRPEGQELAISSTALDAKSGAFRAGGQCRDTITRLIAHGEPAPGMTDEALDKLLHIWEKWHLNNMRPACSHQVVLGWKFCPGHYKDGHHFYCEPHLPGKPQLCDFPNMMGKPCPTCGYKLGSSWLFEPLPQDVIDWAQYFGSSPGRLSLEEKFSEECVVKFLKRHGLEMVISLSSAKQPLWNGPSGDHYVVRFKQGRHSLQMDYWSSQKDQEEGRRPLRSQVLSCIASDIQLPEDPDELAKNHDITVPSQAMATSKLVRRLNKFFYADMCDALETFA